MATISPREGNLAVSFPAARADFLHVAGKGHYENNERLRKLLRADGD
jgi:hypothetical protein